MKNATTGNKIERHTGIAVDIGWLETVASQSLDVVGGTCLFPLNGCSCTARTWRWR